MALLRRVSDELILSLTTTSVRLLQRAISEHSGRCRALLGWIDQDRLQRDLAQVAIDETLESCSEKPKGKGVWVASRAAQAPAASPRRCHECSDLDHHRGTVPAAGHQPLDAAHDQAQRPADARSPFGGKRSRLQAPPSALPSAALRPVAGEGALSQHDPAAPQPE